ncbi:MAG: hypothetical protein RLP15_01500 [Cryomorphaceae bacterium]
MKNLIFALFISSCFSSFGQSVTKSFWTYKGERFEYAQYIPSTGVNEILFGFYDTSNPTWKYETWAQELSWLAEHRKAMIIAPEKGSASLDSTKLVHWVKALSDSVGMKQVKFICLGAGVENMAPLLQNGCDGVIIAPYDTVISESVGNDAVVGIIDSREGDGARSLARRLDRMGAWKFYKMTIGDDPYYFDEHQQVILTLFAKIDSMSSQMANASSPIVSKVITPGAEVLRQGKPYEMELFLAQHGLYTMQVLDLSAKVVWSKKVYLGKGRRKVEIATKNLDWGVYKVVVDGPEFLTKQKLMIRG